MRGRLVFFAALALLLAACEPVTPEPQDPLAQVLEGQAHQTATAQAVLERDARSTQDAAESEQKSAAEIARVMAPIRASQTALDLQITAGAATETAAIATASAASAQTTATNNAAIATSTQAIADFQLEIRKREAVRDDAAARFWGVFWPVVVMVFVGGVVIALVVLVWRLGASLGKDLGPWLIEILDRRNSYHVDRYGRIMIWQDPNATYRAGVLDGSPYRQVKPRAYVNLNAPENKHTEVRSLGASGNVLSSAPGQTDNSPGGLVRRLVEDAIRVNGPESEVLPSWPKLKKNGFQWTSDPWKNAVDALKRLGIVSADPGSRTRLVGEYHCLVELDTAIREDKIKVSRTPPPPYPLAGD